jgi:hypothetical protein
MAIWNSSEAGATVFVQEGREVAWFRSHYHCGDCGTEWDDEWSCYCDDECPSCGSGDWSPVGSDDLTLAIEEAEGAFVVSMSPRSAEHKPSYTEVAVALSAQSAEAYVRFRQLYYWD